MNKALITIAIILLSGKSFGQTEFETYKNGLIYSEGTMGKLGHIVDSLNLKYKTCDFNKVFYSKSQTIGHIVHLDSVNVIEAKRDMDNNISFDAFVKKYPKATIDTNALLVKYKYKNYDDKEVVEYSEVSLNNYYNDEIVKDNNNNLYEKNVANTWVYRYYEKSSYSEASISAFYFPENFKSIPINLKYGRKIGYSDCLIDTTSTKFLKEIDEGWVDLPKGWQNLSLQKKEKLLTQMRSTRVVGGCSMDSRPREHAMHIALLSAETINWEIFLRAHLDIMNDRFERMTDGSYAFAQRKTYIKELEELDINVTDLLIGISLRTENPVTNHYYGSIGRLGRAISESKNKTEFETLILSMIEDDELDDYNRVLAYFLFISYNNYIEDKTEQSNNIEKLKISISKLPAYLKKKIKLTEK